MSAPSNAPAASSISQGTTFVDRPASPTTLGDTRRGDRATVMRIAHEADPFVRGRLLDLGLTPGTIVEHVLDGSMGELAAYRVRGTMIALRNEQARLIRVEPLDRRPAR